MKLQDTAYSSAAGVLRRYTMLRKHLHYAARRYSLTSVRLCGETLLPAARKGTRAVVFLVFHVGIVYF